LGADTDELPFDTVIVMEGGARHVFNPAELLAMPLHRRVRWLLADSLEFRLGTKLVDRREALAALRKQTVEPR
jgi:hypothetical protein